MHECACLWIDREIILHLLVCVNVVLSPCAPVYVCMLITQDVEFLLQLPSVHNSFLFTLPSVSRQSNGSEKAAVSHSVINRNIQRL